MIRVRDKLRQSVSRRHIEGGSTVAALVLYLDPRWNKDKIVKALLQGYI
jgi:hypothetical protein